MGSCREDYLRSLSFGNLRIAFYLAVNEGWSEEEIDFILDEKNRRDYENRKSILLGFAVAVPRNDSIFVMANDYSV